MSTSPVTQKEQGPWATLKPNLVPPVAAAGAIVLPFRDFIIKSALQKGEPAPNVSFQQGIKAGLGAAPTVGMIVGSQMVVQNMVEKAIAGDSKKESLSLKLLSSAIVGTVSAPILAVFNGKTMGWSMIESLRKFSAKQGLAIALQETAFVGGLAVADQLAGAMKEKLGDNKAVEYGAAYTAGALGSLAGHPGNTALTRWQNGMPLSLRNCMWGALTKARGVGLFAVLYKLGKETLNPTVKSHE
jgi:hypothetical protein